MTVYAGDRVCQVQAFYAGVPICECERTLDVVEKHADILFSNWQARDPAVCFQISNWHPRLVCKSNDEIFAAEFTSDDAKLTLCRELGYENWEVACEQSESIDPAFERTVDLMLAGDLEGLKSALAANSNYATQSSAFGHRATLLLYLAANGVETIRQVVPLNAVDIAKLLINSGADTNATMNVYGGQHDVVSLIESSAHPNKAGVAADLISVIRSANP